MPKTVTSAPLVWSAAPAPSTATHRHPQPPRTVAAGLRRGPTVYYFE